MVCKSVSHFALLTSQVVISTTRFCPSTSQLHQRQISEGELVWDKDCRTDLHFVVAASNLRASVFGISRKSCFDIKCEEFELCVCVMD